MSKYIKAHSGAQLPIPDYDGACIALLPEFFQEVLTGKTDNPLTQIVGNNIQLNNVKNIVFFLVDGFGVKQWEDHGSEMRALQRFKKDGFFGSIDSVFPSCTPNALNTLHSNGLTPSQHGLVDWWLYVKEIDQIIATLPFAEMGSAEKDTVLKLGVSASILMDNQTTYENFHEKGIRTRVFTLEKYLNRAHTKVTAKGSEIIPYNDAPSLFSALEGELIKPQIAPTYNFVYWGKIDAAGHEYGLNSNEYKQALDQYFGELEQFLSQIDHMDNTLFVISADHGQININSEETIYLDTIPGLSELFKISPKGKQMLPWGGPREVFIAVKEGAHEKAIEILHNAIGNKVEIVSSEYALNGGLFGSTSKVHPNIRSRIGDIILLPKGNNTVWYHHPGEEPLDRKGDHGGLTDDEIKVPFALLRSH